MKNLLDRFIRWVVAYFVSVIMDVWVVYREGRKRLQKERYQEYRAASKKFSMTTSYSSDIWSNEDDIYGYGGKGMSVDECLAAYRKQKLNSPDRESGNIN